MHIIKSVSVIVVATLAFTGCASTQEYQMYAQGQAQIEAAKYAAEAARYTAMARVAEGGDPTAKVAAVMALAFGGPGGNGGQNSAQLAAPTPPGESVLRWASVLVPAVTQGYAIYANTKLGMAQSNNNARVAESTNTAFLGMAGHIQGAGAAGTAGVVSVANSSNTALTTLAGTSNVALATLAASSNQSLTTLAGSIQAPQPNISYTLSGTGVLGNGTYSTEANQANPNYSLGGNGVIGNGTYSPQANQANQANPTYSLGGAGVIGDGSYTRTNTLNGTGTVGSGAYNPQTVTNNPPPVVITPVVVVPPATPASAP